MLLKIINLIQIYFIALLYQLTFSQITKTHLFLHHFHPSYKTTTA